MRPSRVCALGALFVGFVLAPAQAQYYYPVYPNAYPAQAGYYPYPGQLPGYRPAQPSYSYQQPVMPVWMTVPSTTPEVQHAQPEVHESAAEAEKAQPARRRGLFRPASRTQEADPKVEMKPELKPGEAAAPKLPQTPQAPPRLPAEAAPPAAAGPPAAMATPPAAFGEAAPAGTEAPASYSPQMLGDSLAYFSVGIFNVAANVVFPGLLPTLPLSPPPTDFLAPVATLSGSAFKIADNEGPRPEDRIFLNVNYFSGVFHSIRPGFFPRLRITREVLGVERTFLDGGASFGVRMPVFQFNDSLGGTGNSQLGDVTLIGKYAFYRDTASGNVLSGGLAVTLPTGPAFPVFEFQPALAAVVQVDAINPTILQPYVAGLYKPSAESYVHGFSSFALPSDQDVPTVWFGDIGVGYEVYQSDDLRVIPTIEEHVTIGLSHRGSQGFPIGVVDNVITTVGTHLIFRNSSVVTVGYAIPLTGPQPFNSEIVIQFNLLR